MGGERKGWISGKRIQPLIHYSEKVIMFFFCLLYRFFTAEDFIINQRGFLRRQEPFQKLAEKRKEKIILKFCTGSAFWLEIPFEILSTKQIFSAKRPLEVSAVIDSSHKEGIEIHLQKMLSCWQGEKFNT